MTDQNETIIEGTETETVTHGQNDKRLGDFMRQVTKFGEESALGKDSLPKLAHSVVKAAADGVIDLDAKDSKGKDAAAQIYAKYAAGESKKAIHEKGGVKANESKLRQLIKFGAMTTVDAVEIMQAAFEAREGAIADSVSVKAAYPFYVEVAREQLKSDKPLTEAELSALVAKGEPDAKTVEGELKRVLKILEGLVTGENRDKIKDQHEDTEAAFHLVKGRIEALQLHDKTEALRRQAAALGLKLA